MMLHLNISLWLSTMVLVFVSSIVPTIIVNKPQFAIKIVLTRTSVYPSRWMRTGRVKVLVSIRARFPRRIRKRPTSRKSLLPINLNRYCWLIVKSLMAGWHMEFSIGAMLVRTKSSSSFSRVNVWSFISPRNTRTWKRISNSVSRIFSIIKDEL